MNFSDMNIDELSEYRTNNIFRDKFNFDNAIEELIHILKYKRSGTEISIKCAENNNQTPREWYRSEQNLLDDLLRRCEQLQEKYSK